MVRTSCTIAHYQVNQALFSWIFLYFLYLIAVKSVEIEYFCFDMDLAYYFLLCPILDIVHYQVWCSINVQGVKKDLFSIVWRLLFYCPFWFLCVLLVNECKILVLWNVTDRLWNQHRTLVVKVLLYKFLNPVLQLDWPCVVWKFK